MESTPASNFSSMSKRMSEEIQLSKEKAFQSRKSRPSIVVNEIDKEKSPGIIKRQITKTDFDKRKLNRTQTGET